MAATIHPDSDVADRLVASPSPARQAKGPNVAIVYAQCYFVTIATILGTGVLGLPVTLSHSGLYPFLVSFIGGFLMQAILIYFFVEVLQRAYAVQVINARDQGPENVPLNEIEADEDLEDLEEEHETNGPVMAGHIIIPKDSNITPPNLHLLGELFLGCGVRQMFDVVLMIQFIALLISYALAGSEAYAEVIGVNHFYVIPAFVWILTFAIVFAMQIIQPVVSVLTFAKGCLLLATVMVTFFVGASIHHEVSHDFSYVGAPFLMGTVALGGVVNVMPFLYAKVQPVARQVKGFRLSCLMGLATCAVLNILWCWAVLDIVPQTNSCFPYEVKHNNSFHYVSEGDTPPVKAVCAHNLSLESAAENGEISTLPLTKIIHHLYPNYDWVALLVELFIMISITVSFLTIGAAMHHTLSGWIEAMFSGDRTSNYSVQRSMSKRFQVCTPQCLCRTLLSLVAFSIVFTVAMLNPKGFEYMLEKAASLFINLEAGFFLFLMIRRATNEQNRSLRIPLPIPDWSYHLQYFIPLYFCFAVVYDIFTTLYALVYQGAALPWENTGSNGVIFPISPDLFYNTTTSDMYGQVTTTATPGMTNATASIATTVTTALSSVAETFGDIASTVIDSFTTNDSGT